MGASEFITKSCGQTAKEAFSRAVEKARYDYGHAGYTGTIAEKNSFVVISVPHGENPRDFANKLLDSDDPRVDDKYGPAGCVELGPSHKVEKEKEYLFFGWASS